MGRPARLARADLPGVRAPRPAGDEGFALIEVVVTAALVVLIAAGVLITIDTASKASGQDRARTQAAMLAQEDQERLRAMTPAQLTALVTNPPAPVTKRLFVVGNGPEQDYTVTSSASWVDDQLAAPTCGGSPSAARYLRINSSVSWPSMGGQTPVTEQSQVAIPPSGGSITVQIRDHNQNAVGGIPVSLAPPTGGSPYTGTSSASPNGCAEWDYLTPGNYSLTVGPKASTPPYVDPNGNTTTPAQTVVASDATSQAVQVSFDQGGTVSAPYWTKIGTNVYQSPGAPQQNDQVTFSQSGMTGGARIFGTAGTMTTSLTTPALFPFSSAYTVYPGGCTAADPMSNGQAKDQTVTVTAGSSGIALPPLNAGDPNGIELPSLNVTVQSNGTPVNGASVTITRQLNGTCSSFKYPVQTTVKDPVQSTLTAGRIPYPGVPFGKYVVCAATGGHYQQSSVVSPSWTGTAVTLNVTSSSSSGSCP